MLKQVQHDEIRGAVPYPKADDGIPQLKSSWMMSVGVARQYISIDCAPLG